MSELFNWDRFYYQYIYGLLQPILENQFLLIVIGILSLVVITNTIRNSLSREPFLVLKKFTISSDGNGNLLEIVGRKPGLISFILSKIGIDPLISLVVSKNDINFSQSSLSGNTNVTIPLKSVSSTVTSFYKPWILISIAIILLLIGLISLFSGNGIMGLIGIAVLAIILLALYHFNKKIGILFESSGGRKIGLKFKPSLLEGVTVNQSKSNEAIEIIKKVIQ